MKIVFKSVYMSMPECVYMHYMHAGVHKSKGRALNHLELETDQAVLSHLVDTWNQT